MTEATERLCNFSPCRLHQKLVLQSPACRTVVWRRSASDLEALVDRPSLVQSLSTRQVSTHCWINGNISTSARNQAQRICQRLLSDSEGEVEEKEEREEVQVAVAPAVLRMLEMGKEEEKRRKKGTV